MIRTGIENGKLWVSYETDSEQNWILRLGNVYRFEHWYWLIPSRYVLILKTITVDEMRERIEAYARKQSTTTVEVINMETILLLATRIQTLEARIEEQKELGYHNCWKENESELNSLLTKLMTLVGKKFYKDENYSPVKSISIKDIAELATKVSNEWLEKKLLPYDHNAHYFRTGFIDAQLGKDSSEYIKTLDPKSAYFSILAYEYGYRAGLEAK